MATTRNLGQVQAIWIATTAPSNITMLWYDTSLATPIHKYYDTVTETWLPLATPQEDTYRLDSFSINGTTNVVFNSVMPSINYYVEVLSFVSSSGVGVKSGWSIPDGNKALGQFQFIPADRYQVGVLWYKTTLIK